MATERTATAKEERTRRNGTRDRARSGSQTCFGTGSASSGGWFWTTTAICHGCKSDGLAFRQRRGRQRHRRALPHRGLLGRRGDNRT